jgi:multicomponent Na+:H+ antiporter subunit D
MSVEVLPPVLLALPLLVAAVVRVPAVWRRRALSGTVAIVAAGAVGVLGAVLAVVALDTPVVHWVGGWEPRDGIVVAVPLVADPLAAGAVSFAGVVVALALWHALGSYARTGGMLEVLTLLLLVAVTGFVLSADLFSMFVFVELLGITVYALTASKIDDPAAVPGAFNIAVTSTFGAILFLTGTALVYGATGTPNLALAGERLVEAGATPAAVAGVGLLVAGLGVKAGLVPFHFGHLDAHTVARAPHAGLFSAVTAPVGLVGLLRLQTTLVPGVAGDAQGLRGLVLAVAVLAAVVGAVLSVCQTHLKRLLACSSLAHLGIAAAGLAVGGATAVAGTLVYLLAHGALKLGLFLVVGVLLHRLGHLDVRRLVGRAGEAPVAVATLAAGGLLLAGAPVSGLWVGKVLVAEAAGATELGWLPWLLYAAAATTGAALLRAVWHLRGAPVPAHDPDGAVEEGGPETLEPGRATPAGFTWAPALLVAGSVAVLALPGALRAIGAVAADLLAPGAHAAAVLGSPVPATAAPDPDSGVWTSGSVVAGTVAAIVAVLGGRHLAAVGGQPRRWDPLAATPVRLLRRLHSGHPGDYTAWATLGASCWCGAVLWTHTPW